VGVLSVYVDADPERLTGAEPGFEIALRSGIRDIRDRLKERLAHDEWAAALERIDELAPQLAELADPASEGRGRALFAALSGDAVHRVALREPLPDRVEVDARAHVLPLLAALERSRPAGVVSVSRNAVRAVHRSAETVEEVLSAEIDPATDDWRMLAGPAGRNPAAPQSSAPQRDLYDRRLEQHQVRGVESVARRVEEAAGERGWQLVVVTGDPRMAEPFAEALGDEAREVVIADRILDWRSPAHLVEALEPELAGARVAAERRRVADVVDRAGAGGHGALGRKAVAAALREGRVEVLLIDPEGARERAGAASGPGEEELVAAALETSAAVAPIEDEQARAALAREDGVAALLRW